MLVGACNIVAPEEDEVIIRESTVGNEGVGGFVKSYGEVTEVGCGLQGDGIIGDGEGDQCFVGGRLVAECA